MTDFETPYRATVRFRPRIVNGIRVTTPRDAAKVLGLRKVYHPLDDNEKRPLEATTQLIPEKPATGATT